MLSKLRHANARTQLGASENASLLTGLQAKLGNNLADLKPLGGGTLGIMFSGILDGQARCFKTHVVPIGRHTLRREHAFLQQTSVGRTDPQLVMIDGKSEMRTWMHMKLLRSCPNLTPEIIRKMVGTYEANLTENIGAELVPAEDNIHLLLRGSKEALTILLDQELLGAKVASEAKMRLSHLYLVSREWSLQLCHGDLGPANILCDRVGPIAIDWEDTFWGIAGYDYLYWLTFFSNRQWLTPKALDYTPWGRSGEVSLMVMILLLKCLITVRDGSYHRNKISFDQRLMEVISLD